MMVIQFWYIASANLQILQIPSGILTVSRPKQKNTLELFQKVCDIQKIVKNAS